MRLDDQFWSTRRFEPKFARMLSRAGGPSEAPGMLWLFGEQGHSFVCVTAEWQTTPHHAVVPSQESEARIERAKQLFPEAQIATINEDDWKKAAC